MTSCAWGAISLTAHIPHRTGAKYYQYPLLWHSSVYTYMGQYSSRVVSAPRQMIAAPIQ